jgi:ABC-type cobalamin/Fe3+-siderophores transport system ATPase subunit
MALHDINLALQFEKVMLIKDGSILGIGPPKIVLTRDSLREAFGIEIEVRRTDHGAYITHEQWS